MHVTRFAKVSSLNHTVLLPSLHRFSNQTSSNVELELWNSAVCPFGQRAWWTVLEKQIPSDKYIIHWEDLGNKSETFKSAYKQSLFTNPDKDGTVPTIKHRGKYITGINILTTNRVSLNFFGILYILYFILYTFLFQIQTLFYFIFKMLP